MTVQAPTYNRIQRTAANKAVSLVGQWLTEAGFGADLMIFTGPSDQWPDIIATAYMGNAAAGLSCEGASFELLNQILASTGADKILEDAGLYVEFGYSFAFGIYHR